MDPAKTPPPATGTPAEDVIEVAVAALWRGSGPVREVLLTLRTAQRSSTAQSAGSARRCREGARDTAGHCTGASAQKGPLADVAPGYRRDSTAQNGAVTG